MLFSPSLTKGSIEFLILSILEDGELYGYEITKQIQKRSNSLLAFRRSSIYPVLSRMEHRGWITRRWTNGNRRRAFFSLTEDGSEALERQRVEWRIFTTAVNLVVNPNGSSAAEPQPAEPSGVEPPPANPSTTDSAPDTT